MCQVTQSMSVSYDLLANVLGTALDCNLVFL